MQGKKILQKYIKKDNDVMILGNYAGLNVGDEAILQAILANIEKFTPRNRIYVPSRNPQLINDIHNVNGVKLGIFSVLKALFKSKVIIVGGGSIFSNYAGTFVYALPFFMIFAKLIGRKVIIYSIGFDQNTNFFLKISTYLSFLLSNFVSVRDEISLINLRFINRIRKISIVRDPVLGIKTLLSKRDLEASKKHVDLLFKKYKLSPNKRLIALTTLPIKNEEFNNEFLAKFPEIISKVLVQNSDVEVVVLNFYIGKDDIFNQKWIKKLSKKAKVISIDEFISPFDMIEVLKKMDKIFAVRLHAKILSYAMDLKFVPIIYAEKCEAFLNQVNMEGFDYKSMLDFEFVNSKINGK